MRTSSINIMGWICLLNYDISQFHWSKWVLNFSVFNIFDQMVKIFKWKSNGEDSAHFVGVVALTRIAFAKLYIHINSLYMYTKLRDQNLHEMNLVYSFWPCSWCGNWINSKCVVFFYVFRYFSILFCYFGRKVSLYMIYAACFSVLWKSYWMWLHFGAKLFSLTGLKF